MGVLVGVVVIHSVVIGFLFGAEIAFAFLLGDGVLAFALAAGVAVSVDVLSVVAGIGGAPRIVARRLRRGARFRPRSGRTEPPDGRRSCPTPA